MTMAALEIKAVPDCSVTRLGSGFYEGDAHA
jgi:hypothetical protein